jgi:hypothetical protein
MDEILNKLVESELLTADTKASLVEAFTAKLDEAVQLARAEAEVAVRAELTEQFITEKELIVDAVDSKTEEYLKRHFEELLEEFDAFRDLEAEYAEKLVEAKEQMAQSLKVDMAELVEKLDQFNTELMQEHFVELEESINEVKKLSFGKEIFEAVAKTFEKNFTDNNATLNALKEAEDKLDTVTKELTESKKALDAAAREHKLNKVLENIHGRPREVMVALLDKVPTEKLEEGYNKFIEKVLGTKPEKESVTAPVLAENDNQTLDTDKLVVLTGDGKSINESQTTNTQILSDAAKAELQRLAGIID